MEKLFHIHIDTKSESPGIHRAAQETLGFYSHNFNGHPDGYPHFEPTQHSSFKTTDKRTFDQTWGKLEDLMSSDKSVSGYIEGEFIPLDEDIPERPMGRFIAPPIQIQRRRLREDLGEVFRETEVHIVMDFDRSERRVIDSLLDAGFYGALMDKPDHRAIVLTMQGSRRLIRPLIAAIRKHLLDVGGIVRGSIKEELAIKHALYGISVGDLPEVADEIRYLC